MRYKPSRDDESKAVNRFIYESGRLEENDYILTILEGVENE